MFKPAAKPGDPKHIVFLRKPAPEAWLCALSVWFQYGFAFLLFWFHCDTLVWAFSLSKQNKENYEIVKSLQKDKCLNKDIKIQT